MQRKKVFISSVQSEFAKERQMLFEYLTTDALLSKTDLKTDLKMDDTDILIISMIRENKKITIPQIAKYINKGISATKDRITKMKKYGYIERIGSLKGGYWHLIEK